MTKLEQIEHDIQSLSPEEFAELRAWVLERDWEEWDRQIASDADAGKLDQLFAEAQDAHRHGKSTKF